MPRPIVMPDPQPSQYSIKELEIAARIRDQVAEVRLSQTFKNTGSQVMEVVFVFPLPHDATIDQLTFMVDGTEFAGELLSADEARSIFEGYSGPRRLASASRAWPFAARSKCTSTGVRSASSFASRSRMSS